MGPFTRADGKRLIQTRLLNELAKEIVDGRIGEGDHVRASWKGGFVVLDPM